MDIMQLEIIVMNVNYLVQNVLHQLLIVQNV